MITKEDPLGDFAWNQAEADPGFYHGLIAIVTFTERGPVAVGTGFIISSDGNKATAVTAAHVLSEIRRLQSGEPRHNPTALEMFLPPPKLIDVDRSKLRAMCRDGDKAQLLIVTGLVFDERTDIGILTLATQDAAESTVPLHEFVVGNRVPQVGELICVLSFGDLGTDDFENQGQGFKFSLSLRPILRTGRVLAYYPDGNRLCKGPCIETSIPVYSGMSGGPAFAFTASGSIRPIALVCSDPDEDGDQKDDRTHVGASILALLPTRAWDFPNGRHVGMIQLKATGWAGEMDPKKMTRSYGPRQVPLLAEYSNFWRFARFKIR